MATKKTVAIIGTSGNMGSAIAKNLARGNYRLLLFGRQRQKVEQVIDQIRKMNPSADIESTACPFDASWEADIIIPAVSYGAEKEVAEKIRPVATQKVVISVSNPLNQTYDGLTTPPDSSAGEELQATLPDAKVVKAFNTVFARDFSLPVVNEIQPDVFIAGNDDGAVNTVAELVSVAGFNPVIAGNLSISRTLENMTALLIGLNKKYKYNRIGGWKVLHN